ncbi:MAG TPA: glycosyltransferase family 4 protein [Pyrinomonadaceae bacterium]
MKAFVLTDIPSPYQVELFNEIAAQKKLDLSVAYVRRADPSRLWQPAQAQFDSCSIDDAFAQATQLAAKADVAVFNYYNNHLAERLIRARAATGKPWCFWGERPGLRQPRFAGRLFRRWKLKMLRRSRAPIWGVGEFALQQYKHEFGRDRSYKNVPYFSDLDRFARGSVGRDRGSVRRVFLFCGSLSWRKGVDLVARAFVRLAREVTDVSLRIVGDGELRESLRRTLRTVDERVEFTGFVPWEQLPVVYADADVLCVPSRYDGWGLVVPEGLASALPVIASDRMGAALDLIKGGVNGWLTQAGDEDAVFAAMREAAMLSNEQLAEFSIAARETIENHSLQRGAQRFAAYACEAVESWN